MHELLSLYTCQLNQLIVGFYFLAVRKYILLNVFAILVTVLQIVQYKLYLFLKLLTHAWT